MFCEIIKLTWFFCKKILKFISVSHLSKNHSTHLENILTLKNYKKLHDHFQEVFRIYVIYVTHLGLHHIQS